MDDKPKTPGSTRLKEQSSRIEEQIRESQRRKDEKQFLEELSKRISISREGRLDFEKGNYPEAIAKYRRFLNVTAKSLGVETHEIKPSLFEEKVRGQESLLVSAILLDLCKILDKLDTESATEERRLYQRLYIGFTVGQNFQGFAAENLRKHIIYSKAIKHKAEFWGVYNSIKLKRFCIVACAVFGESAPEVDVLRAWRDGQLSSTMIGRAFIAAYYRSGYLLLPLLTHVPGARRTTRAALSAFVKRLPDNGSKAL